MTITIDDGIYGKKITCDKDTMNYLSIIFSEAENRYKSIGLHALARQARENADLIYNALNDCNYYD